MTAPGKKMKPCLRCEEPTLVTTENRLCVTCRSFINRNGFDAGMDARPELNGEEPVAASS